MKKKSRDVCHAINKNIYKNKAEKNKKENKMIGVCFSSPTALTKKYLWVSFGGIFVHRRVVAVFFSLLERVKE